MKKVLIEKNLESKEDYMGLKILLFILIFIFTRILIIKLLSIFLRIKLNKENK